MHQRRRPAPRKPYIPRCNVCRPRIAVPAICEPPFPTTRAASLRTISFKFLIASASPYSEKPKNNDRDHRKNVDAAQTRCTVVASMCRTEMFFVGVDQHETYS
ncbi:hypothetical protein MTO96_032665 [Rhipicephalus appendiculatus]